MLTSQITEVKRTVFNGLALHAKDQLRQRMAWALAQIIVVSVEGIEVKRGQAEIWLAFHDIFVRHSFGLYGDILREVAYSPMMGMYLTYLNSRSFAASGVPPDENFAREFMQLFSIGLWKLNLDGTFKVDSEGNKIPTYTNKHIQSFARVWTGFTLQTFRGNIEGHRGVGSTNFLDPMRVSATWHDTLPKLGLDDQYLGDSYPLCVDIPDQPFLRQGATFENIGSAPPRDTIPGDLGAKYGYPGPPPTDTGPTSTPFSKVYQRFMPAPQSSLFQALCGRNGNELACSFPSVVTLGRDLACHGRECLLGKEAVYIKIVDPQTNETVFYEYKKPPCVHLAFYEGARRLALNYNGQYMCGDPMEAAAGAVCCLTPQVGGYYGFDACDYHLQQTTFEKAAQKCAGLKWDTSYNFGRFYSWLHGSTPRDLEICKLRDGAKRLGIRVFSGCGYDYRASWLNETCSVEFQVDRFGRVNLVHGGTTVKALMLDSGSVFHVHWQNGLFPAVASNCGAGACRVHGATCVCNFTVTKTQVFTTPSSNGSLPSSKVILKGLRIGSPPLSMFPRGTYTRCTSAACNASSDVEVYVKSSDGDAAWDQDTIFKTIHPTAHHFNKLSTVNVGDAFSFRNVPHFITFNDPSQRDMETEINALIDTVLMHENTAPFVSQRLIQRFVTSNPSPRYVAAVATAFRTGEYAGFGSGKYGDLAATVACIFLDVEARDTILDAEPTWGRVREPHLKFLHIFRSLEFQAAAQKEFVIPNPSSIIGMAPYVSPSVFSFYLPDFQPLGKLRKSGLQAPEMMLGTAPFLLGFLNGFTSLIKNGLTKADKGFGSSWPVDSVSRRDGTKNDGELTFAPLSASADAAGVVDELDLVLTSGRLDNASKAVVTAAYLERLALPSPYPLPAGLVLKLHATNYQCIEAHNGGTFRLTLQPTATVTSGTYAKTVYFNNGRGEEIKIPSVRHWAWAGAHLFIDQGPNDPSPSLNCSLVNSVFKVSDTIIVSSESLVAGPSSALKLAQTLLVASAEFHATSINVRAPQPRLPPVKVQSQGRPYKAVVVLFLVGGADSWNILVPHTGCVDQGSSFDLFAEYRAQRAEVALSASELLPISSPNNATHNVQPCTGFGVNPALSKVHELYNAGDAAFLANVGALVEPLTRTQYAANAKKYPSSLFAHNVQQTTAKTVHAGSKKKAKGILGRMVEALNGQPQPFATSSYSMSGVQAILDGNFPPAILGSQGVEMLSNDLGQTVYLEKLVEYSSESGFAEAHAQLLNTSVVESSRLGAILASAPKPAWTDTSYLGRQLKNVASVILARNQTATEREVFYVQSHGWDSHFQALKPGGGDVYTRLQEVNTALAEFEAAMKKEGVWDDVVLLTSSDFGRKLVGNSGGTDHAWGGHYFAMGGSVKGGQMYVL